MEKEMIDLEVRKKIGIQWVTAAPVIEWIINGGNWYKKSKAKREEGVAKN